MFSTKKALCPFLYIKAAKWEKTSPKFLGASRVVTWLFFLLCRS